MAELKTIYLDALAACAPANVISAIGVDGLPSAVVAIGKCAGAMYDALASRLDVSHGFVAVPDGYPAPKAPAEVHVGGHPQLTRASFDAGRALMEFMRGVSECTFLISGGGSACVEWPLGGFAPAGLTHLNRRLVDAGIPIGEMNTVRRHVSSIKGGRLAATLARSVTLLLSDVAAGRSYDVASGPSVADPTTTAEAIAILESLGGCDAIVTAMRGDSFPETVKQLPGAEVRLVADNRTLLRAAQSSAAHNGWRTSLVEESMDGDVESVAVRLFEMLDGLPSGTLLIAGGEPTVVRHGRGRGGRCSELAVRFARHAADRPTAREALFASSDGVDGSSGAAGIILAGGAAPDAAQVEQALRESDSMTIAERIGQPIIIPPTGNNLRDLFLLARS